MSADLLNALLCGGRAPRSITRESVSLRRIIEDTSLYFGVTLSELRGPRRTKILVRARSVIAWLARQYTEASYPDIATALNKDHSSLIKGFRRCELKYMDDAYSIRQRLLQTR